jgi:hypothetical protein
MGFIWAAILVVRSVAVPTDTGSAIQDYIQVSAQKAGIPGISAAVTTEGRYGFFFLRLC